MTFRNRGSYRIIIPFAFLLVFCAQCGGDDPAAPGPAPAPLSVTNTIDQTGGRVSLGDEAWVIIPAGALTDAVEITITRISGPVNPPANYVSRGAGYSFTPHGLPFDQEVTIAVTYDTDGDSAVPSMVRLENDDDTSWDSLPEADCTDGIATYNSTSLSIYSVTSFQALENVYVSSSSRGPNAAGTIDDPLPSIHAGIEASQVAGEPHPPVLVAVGAYEESGLAFVDGVSIQGGLDPQTWELPLEPGAYSLVDLGTSTANAVSITSPTLISGLELWAYDAVIPGMNSVALHSKNCNAELRFENCRFKAGNGSNGIDGIHGSPGATGGSGNSAGDGYPPNHWTGGAGGTGPSYFGGGNGGNGGGVAGVAGNAGYGDFCGGLGGAGAGVTFSFDGGYGVSGNNGQSGSRGTNNHPGMVDGWSPVFAPNDATGGAHGCGGGGGGGGFYWIVNGKGGGGGGGGGLGGFLGNGGGGGGSSFAVYLGISSPVFERCEFIAGDGGRGGKGGNGGIGGAGGTGGISYGGENGWVQGGNGGAGGAGGFGGSGGGGAGGHSICVFLSGVISEDTEFIRCDSWVTGEGGRGGSGGQASYGNEVGAQGPRGDDGTAKTIGP